MNQSGGISVHAYDVANGKPAVGLITKIVRCDGNTEIVIADGVINNTGTLEHPCVTGEGIVTGQYIAYFEVSSFFKRLGTNLSDIPFLGVVQYHFGIADSSEHFHLPFKFTPWGYSLFRGGL